jgi:alkyl sulfatase BDS1-like metallo-beta-lactamase superfamily hydrolase
LVSLLAACSHARPLQTERLAPTPAVLDRQCNEAIGPARVLEPAPGVFMAIGYDTANVILVKTPEGNVIIDTGMSPARAREIKAALDAKAPGPVKAVILTHSHIDHVGGASVWAGDDTPIWGTDAFRDHLLKQYALFQQAEMRRGAGQFGEHVPVELLPCSALGRRADFDGARENGVRIPNRTFSGAATFSVGGVRFELYEAHGETHDQLFVWVPQLRALMPGDNYYHSFPNLYTIRGTSARPVDAWIASLDAMRALSPVAIVPSHTVPVVGEAVIAQQLTDYRDAIQWVRDETVRGANAGRSADALAAGIKLPAHLAGKPYLAEMYGQLDWSVRGIYGSNLGWFDERPEALYPADAAAKEIALMGGPAKVEAEAARALAAGDVRWAVFLLAKLTDTLTGDEAKRVGELLANALETEAAQTFNTNGRGYLYESAFRLRNGIPKSSMVKVDDALLREIPVAAFFKIMAIRLMPDKAGDVFESITVNMTDSKESYHVTVRRGVAEVVQGAPLPGTPAPVATLTTDSMTWKRLGLKQASPAGAIASGKLSIDGSTTGLLSFLGRFDTDL